MSGLTTALAIAAPSACPAQTTPATPQSNPTAGATVVDGSKSRAFHAFTSTGPRRFENSGEAQGVVNKIVQFVPLRHAVQAFVTDDPGDVPNAEARLSADNQRIIGFNRSFMRQIQAQAGNYWSLVGIAAHEIGHHAGNHNFLPTTDCKLNNDVELEADYYAGFALGKMEVKLDDAMSTLRSLPAIGSCSHPGREPRILVLGQGWKQATAGQRPEAAVASAGTRSVNTASTALSSFKVRKNRDVHGHDLEKIQGVTQERCAEQCLKNTRCRGFSFDRWNGWCFLKSALPSSVLDPAAVMAVRVADPFPNVATTPFEKFNLRRKKFSDAAFSATPAATHDACQASCTDSRDCVAHTFAKATGICQLFKETVGYFYDEGFDSGFKRQRPAIDGVLPASAGVSAPAGRMEQDRDKYFKGDGYAKHEDTSIKACETLCLNDARCQAIEHIDKQAACRLYAKAQPGIATKGSTVGYKRPN